VAAAASALALALTLTGAALPERTEKARVRRVLDGDSILLSNGNEVRYLGINTDEAGDPFSEKARTFNRRLVEGKQVRLAGDRERHDRYGRILAYVYVGDQFVNGELVRAGLAHLFVFGPLREEPTLAALQREARAGRRGMWGPGGPTGPLKITSPRSRYRPPPRLRAITVCNVSDDEIDLEGFSLEAERRRFRFPRSRIRAGHVALIIMSKGKDHLTGPGPRRLHWPDGLPSGTIEPTTLTLRSPTGEVIDRVRLPTSTSRKEPKREREL